MNPAPGSVFYEPQLAAMPQLREKPRQGFATWKTAWNPGPNVANSTAAIGMRAGLVLEGVRKTYRARYYNPNTGRFLSEDPMGFAGSGTNLYAYAKNNPINLKDPYGLCSGLNGIVAFGELLDYFERLYAEYALIPGMMVGTGFGIFLVGFLALDAMILMGPIGWMLAPILLMVMLAGVLLAVEGLEWALQHDLINPSDPFGPPIPIPPTSF
jgi:hypothetical protein